MEGILACNAVSMPKRRDRLFSLSDFAKAKGAQNIRIKQLLNMLKHCFSARIAYTKIVIL